MLATAVIIVLAAGVIRLKSSTVDDSNSPHPIFKEKAIIVTLFNNEQATYTGRKLKADLKERGVYIYNIEHEFFNEIYYNCTEYKTVQFVHDAEQLLLP